MKKILLLIIIFPAFAFGNPLLKQLLEVNKQWANNGSRLISGE